MKIFNPLATLQNRQYFTYFTFEKAGCQSHGLLQVPQLRKGTSGILVQIFLLLLLE